MNRRTFLESSVAAGVLASLPIKTFGATHRIEKVGVQLYTVRDAMKTDFDGTLGKVAKIGFKEVEFAGYFNHSPKDVRATLDKVGLSAPSAHFGPDIIQNHLPPLKSFVERRIRASSWHYSHLISPGTKSMSPYRCRALLDPRDHVTARPGR